MKPLNLFSFIVLVVFAFASQAETSLHARPVRALVQNIRVSFPTEYRMLLPNGQVDFDSSLNRWMRDGRPFVTQAGEREYWLPMHLSDISDTVYLPLKNWQKDPATNEIVITQPSYVYQLYKQTDAKDVTEQDPNLAPNPAGPTDFMAATCVGCQLRGALPRLAIADDPVISQNLTAADTKLAGRYKIRGAPQKMLSNRDVTNSVIRNFNKTCPVPFTTFYKEILQASNENGIPYDLILGMITAESSGNCKVGSSTAGAIGIMQVIGKSKKCTAAQLAALFPPETGQIKTKDENDKQMWRLRNDTSIQCAQNPYTSLRDGIEIIKEKRNYLQKKIQGFQTLERERPRDSWRLVTAAYNGGERWVEEGIRQCAKQNPQDSCLPWDNLKSFFVTQNISSLSAQQYQVRQSQRALRHATDNISHTELILSRENNPSEFGGLDFAWRRTLCEAQVDQVACSEL